MLLGREISGIPCLDCCDHEPIMVKCNIVNEWMDGTRYIANIICFSLSGFLLSCVWSEFNSQKAAQKCYKVFRTSNRKTTGKPQMIKPSTNCRTVSSFTWQPWKQYTFKMKDRENNGSNHIFMLEIFHVNSCWSFLDPHVYLRIKLPWLVQSTITGQEGRVAAAARNWESPSTVKPGGSHPVLVVLNTATLQLIRIKSIIRGIKVKK